ERAICKSSFKALWTQLLQHIRSCRPHTDLCWQRQQNSDQLISANLPEEGKTAAIKKQQDHLQLVQKEMAVYNEMTAACKKTCDAYQMSIGPSPPSNSLPLEPTATWANVLPDNGSLCEGLQKQVNFLIDEGMSSGKGSNEVAENSSPESRLNIPQLVGLEDGTVLVNTFDWQAHLSPYFRKLPQIKSYQHFRYLLCRLPQSVFVNNKETCNILIALCAFINSLDAKRPGVVLARTHSDAEPVSFQLLCDPEVLPPVVCVPALATSGLATDR
ncbi:hypothetical protein GOODEAATRI_029477, partial [Goodea atripinnis]